MSAWLVSKRHIDLMVSAGIAFREIKPGEATDIGAMLWDENARSVDYCYEGRYPEDVAHEPYAFTPYAVEDPDVIFKQFRCYGYQACEHPEWEESESYRLVEAICATVAASVGSTEEGMYDRPGWDSAPWGVGE